MSIVEPRTHFLMDSIRVYWRTHDEIGVIGRADQTWWYVVTDPSGFSTALPAGNYLTDDMLDLSDLVVCIAEEYGLTISADQVKVDTGHRTAEWQRGY